MRPMRRRAWRAGGLRIAALGLALSALGPVCAPVRGPGAATDTLTIGAYSVVREAFHEGLLPAFAVEWRRRTGRTVRFEESYNASGAQSRAIVSGFDADIAVLSLEGDMTRLVKAGLVRESWKAGPTRGIVTHSLVVIGVREGNPRRIADWADLARPDVGVLYPDPKTSGGARWNINAIYGAGLLKDKAKEGGPGAVSSSEPTPLTRPPGTLSRGERVGYSYPLPGGEGGRRPGEGIAEAVASPEARPLTRPPGALSRGERGRGDGDRRAARELLAAVQARVVNMDSSGRQSMATFERGTGDAVVTYENELLLQRKKTGVEAPYVIPPATLLIESPAAVIEESVKRHGNREVAEAFLAFLRSDEGQRIMADYGFRPLDPRLDTSKDHRPLPPRLFTIADLGGWGEINKEVYDQGGVWDSLFTRRSGRGN